MSHPEVINVNDEPEPHVPPPISRMTRVRFWPNGAQLEQDELPGFVAEIESMQSCHIMVMLEGGIFQLRESCYHRGDWQIQQRPHRFDDNTSGIWELADVEIAERKLAARFVELEQQVAALTLKVSANPKRAAAPKPDPEPDPEPKPDTTASGKPKKGAKKFQSPEPEPATAPG